MQPELLNAVKVKENKARLRKSQPRGASGDMTPECHVGSWMGSQTRKSHSWNVVHGSDHTHVRVLAPWLYKCPTLA